MLLLAAALAACQPVPRPFQPDVKTGALGQFAFVSPRASLVIPPVAGIPDPTSSQLSASVAAALQQLEIGATTRGGTVPRYQLRGILTKQTQSGSHNVVVIDWLLINPQGKEINYIRQNMAVSSYGWNTGNKDVFDTVAADLAPQVDLMLQSDRPRAPARTLAVAFVEPVYGAPGDGQEALAFAMSKVLARNNVTITRTARPDAYRVLGQVLIRPHGVQQELVQISWELKSPDGQRLGAVTQQNTVARGSLTRKWGHVADIVAEKAADGIIQILRAAATARKAGDPAS
jgi:hypothetical protein